MSTTAEGGSVGGAVGDAKPPARRTKAQKRKDQRHRRHIREYLARLTPEEQCAYHVRQEEYASKRAAKKARKRKTTKAGKYQDLPPESTDPSAGECIKCGFRTGRDWCPDCGRPVY